VFRYTAARKWKNCWSLISKLKSEGNLNRSKGGTYLVLEDEDSLHDNLKVIKLRSASMFLFFLVDMQ
jgi:hypothetical protein